MRSARRGAAMSSGAAPTIPSATSRRTTSRSRRSARSAAARTWSRRRSRAVSYLECPNKKKGAEEEVEAEEARQEERPSPNRAQRSSATTRSASAMRHRRLPRKRMGRWSRNPRRRKSCSQPDRRAVLRSIRAWCDRAGRAASCLLRCNRAARSRCNPLTLAAETYHEWNGCSPPPLMLKSF